MKTTNDRVSYVLNSQPQLLGVTQSTLSRVEMTRKLGADSLQLDTFRLQAVNGVLVTSDQCFTAQTQFLSSFHVALYSSHQIHA